MKRPIRIQFPESALALPAKSVADSLNVLMTREQFKDWIQYRDNEAVQRELEWARTHGAAIKTVGGEWRIHQGRYLEAKQRDQHARPARKKTRKTVRPLAVPSANIHLPQAA